MYRVGLLVDLADTPETAVAAGIAWLNEYGPAEWWERVDLDRLDISSNENCVLAQVFAADAAECGMSSGYIWAVDHEYSSTLSGDEQWLGFCDSSIATNEDLDAEWTKQITLLQQLAWV